MDMKKLFITTFISCFVAAPAAHAAVAIFACEPEWDALAQEIGGDRVSITTATTALQDPHQVQARPSLLAAMRNAQMVFCDGAGLEDGWLPLLIRQAGNESVQEGQAGHLLASRYVPKLGVPQKIDRSQGDIHAEGNPHIVTDPRNIRIVAKVLAQRLSALDPANANAYDTQYQAFDAKFSGAIAGWEKKAAALRGMPIVVKHSAWVYLENWLGLKIVASLEPKPGVPPTPGHLAEVLSAMQASPARAIVVTAYEDPKPAQWLSEKTGIPVLALPYTVGGNDKVTDLFSLYDQSIDQLLEARK
jgi:zinc/manganese transport system substrate-binding protein